MPTFDMLAGDSNASVSAVCRPKVPLCSIQHTYVNPLESALPRFTNHFLVTPIESTRELRVLSFSTNSAPVTLTNTTLTNTAPCNPSRMNTSGECTGGHHPSFLLNSLIFNYLCAIRSARFSRKCASQCADPARTTSAPPRHKSPAQSMDARTKGPRPWRTAAERAGFFEEELRRAAPFSGGRGLCARLHRSARRVRCASASPARLPSRRCRW